MMLLSVSVAHATVWPRTYGSWSRLANGGTVSGTIKVPVIFVNFSQSNNDDANVVSDANQTAWINNLNATNNYGGNQYFKDMSYGNVNVEFVKVGSYTASGKASAYANTYVNLVSTAVQGVNYSNWSNFDSNNDGFVDMVLLIFAGHADGDYTSGSKSVTSIYPASGWLDSSSGSGTTISGISNLKFSRYLYVNDLATYSTSRANLGTALHELGHALFDLPDYYNRSTGNPSYGSNMGFWDCMDYGTFFGEYAHQSNAVPGLSAFSKMLNGWLTPKELTYGQHVTLHPLNNNAEAYMIKESDTHYYILEARYNTSGSWDAGLTSGLILTEVNESDGGSWIINHTTNDGRVTVVRADKEKWTDSNYSSNINTQPFGPNVKAIDSFYGSIFATKTVENIVVNDDGSVEFDFMGGDPDNTMSLEDLTDGTIVQVSNYYGFGTLVNDNNTVKAVGGSQNIVDRYYTDGRTYNTSYSATPSTTDANHLWQVMSNNGQKYLVNVGTAQTINVANPTALISTPAAINISAISNLSNAYTLSSTEGKMSASVFQNIPAGYAVDNTLVSGYSPNSDKFTYNGTFSSSKILHIDMNLSTCTGNNENVISIGQQDLSAWFGKLIHMYYTRSNNSLEINFMTSSGSSRVTVAPKSDNLVIELSSAGLTVDGTLYTPASYGGLSDIINLSTIYAGSQEGSGRSRASNYNISIGHNNYVDSTYPVSAIATDDYTTAWVFREVTGVTPRTQQEVFGGDAPTPTTATITVTPTSKTLEVGETLQLTATTNSNATVTYSSNDSNVATVSNTGLVTAVGAGTATITVSVPANTQFTAASTTCTLTVTEQEVDPVDPVDPDEPDEPEEEAIVYNKVSGASDIVAGETYIIFNTWGWTPATYDIEDYMFEAVNLSVGDKYVGSVNTTGYPTEFLFEDAGDGKFYVKDVATGNYLYFYSYKSGATTYYYPAEGSLDTTNSNYKWTITDNNGSIEMTVGSTYYMDVVSYSDGTTSYTLNTTGTNADLFFYKKEMSENVEGVLNMAKKQVAHEGTVTKTIYKASTAALTKGADTEFLILSENGWWGMGNSTTASVGGPGATGTYTNDINVAGNLYTFKWTSQGHLYNVGLGQYLNVSGNSLSYGATGSTVWNITGSGSKCVIKNGNKSIKSPSAEAGAFTYANGNNNLTIFTPSTIEEPGIIYTDADPYPFTIKADYATLYCADAYKMPGTDIVGYFIKDAVDQGVLTYQKRYQSGDIVPAGTSLLLTGTKGDYEATLYEEKTTGTETAIVYTDAEDNQLEGRRDARNYTWSERNNVYYYKLTWKDKDNHSLGVYFYWGAENGEAFELANPYTAYLAVDKDSPSRSIIMPGHDDVNSIGVVEFQPTDNAVYTISGMRVNDSTNLPSGIYIRNGKKFFVR